MVTVETDYEYRSRSATALNELAILDQMGREGWELIDLGPFNLHFQRPRVRAPWCPGSMRGGPRFLGRTSGKPCARRGGGAPVTGCCSTTSSAHGPVHTSLISSGDPGYAARSTGGIVTAKASAQMLDQVY
jgi:hypothetical protein